MAVASPESVLTLTLMHSVSFLGAIGLKEIMVADIAYFSLINILSETFQLWILDKSIFRKGIFDQKIS